MRTIDDEEDEVAARELLTKTALLVEPLMKKRGWFVPVLAEFSPRNEMLEGININAGAKICIRMRPPARSQTLYPFHYILGIMLHELTHIVRSAHDALFYKQMDELKVEADELMRAGKTGLLGTAYKTGGERLSREAMRKKWLEKEKTLHMQQPTPQRLGGATMPHLTPQVFRFDRPKRNLVVSWHRLFVCRRSKRRRLLPSDVHATSCSVETSTSFNRHRSLASSERSPKHAASTRRRRRRRQRRRQHHARRHR